MPAPLVSIIIPTKNAAQYIKSCLSSILNQTFTHFEIIVVDGSNDNTSSLVYEFNDDRINLITQQSQGIYASMNEGIQKANGLWLLFLGADDLLYDNDVLKDVFENSNYSADLILGKVENINRQTKKVKHIYSNSFDCGLYWRNTIHHQGVFYRKSIFVKHKYNEDFKILSDYALNLDLLRSKTTSFFIDRFISKSNADGVSKRFTKELYQEELKLKKQHTPYWAYLLNCVWIPIKRLIKS
jgi:putative colanic acid biosynthesis glycosyltransferase